MPGVKLSNFVNPLRFQLPNQPGIRVVDLLIDIILPELASSRPRAGTQPPLTDTEILSVPPDVFADDEARFIRSRVREGLQQTWPFPDGGALPDVTWAFNQATGARALDDSAVLPGRNRTRLSWLNEGDVLSLHAVGHALSVVLTRRCRRI